MKITFGSQVTNPRNTSAEFNLRIHVSNESIRIQVLDRIKDQIFDLANGLFSPTSVSEIPSIVEDYSVKNFSHRDCRRIPGREFCLCREMTIFAWLFPFLLTICLVGNCLNILTFRKQQLRCSNTIRLLTVKAIANMAFVVCLVPELAYAYNYRSKNRKYAELFWFAKPWLLWLTNGFGTLATLTIVAMTVVRYLFVSKPVWSRTWFTEGIVFKLVGSFVMASFGLHAVYPASSKVIVHRLTCSHNETGKEETKVAFTIQPPNKQTDFWLYAYQRLCFWLQAGIILLSVLILSLLSIQISRRILRLRKNSLITDATTTARSQTSSYKRCVTLLTITTALCHLCLELPSMFNFVYAGIRDSNRPISDGLCTATIVSNFLSILNASLPFVVYLVCVKKFRQTFLAQISMKSRPGSERQNCNENATTFYDHGDAPTITKCGTRGSITETLI